MTDLLSIPRHGGEELRVSINTYKGRQFLSLRQFYDAGGGIMQPSRIGCTVPLWAIPALRDALKSAIDQTAPPTAATIASLAAYRARIADADAVIDDSDRPA